LEVEIQDDLPDVPVDETRMIQVLGNLVSNALRHTPAGGQVTLSAQTHESWVTLKVADTGPGIDPDDLPYIFDRFYRADKSRAESDGGSGLGLAIAKAYIDAHGGRIEVHSQMGQGTDFTIYLPL
jgi:signal transduction histidine kinase